jgi:hypothetical protein
VAAALAAAAPQPSTGTGPPPLAGDAQTAPAASAGEGDGIADGDSISLEEARKLRREAAALRRRNAELEAADKNRQTADLSVLEKAQSRIAELERLALDATARDQSRSLRLAALTAAHKLGFRSPEIAWRLIDSTKVEWDDGGEPKGVEKLLRQVLDDEPYLARTQHPDIGGGPRGATGASGPNMNDILRGAAGGR